MQYAVDVEKIFSCHVVGMASHFAQAQDGCETDIFSFEKLAPFIAGTLQKQMGEPLCLVGPGAPIMACIGLEVVHPDRFAKLLVELWFDRADGYVFPVGRLIGVVPRGATIDQVDASLV